MAISLGKRRQYLWESDPALVAFVRDRLELRLGNYERIPDEVRDHYETEIEALAGGYSYRQVLELIQNAADAILEDGSDAGESGQGRIMLRLSGNRLYAANTGAPLSQEGIVALLSARSSSKRRNQIGRFGIGFKSLLGLHGRIDVFSRSVCLRFDPAMCGQTIRERINLPGDHPTPGLRIAWPIDAQTEFQADPILLELSSWATTVVRVEIGHERPLSHVSEELSLFPGEFLLFLPVDVELELHHAAGAARTLERRRTPQDVKLIENGQESPWHVVETHLPLTDSEARADATTVHSRNEVPVAWALPLAPREDRAGRFWAFFPTDTPSRIPGLLNAPWKVNSDRTALIHGPYNAFLMEAASELIVSAFPRLATTEDPARPLDMFPRELETREECARPLVDAVWHRLATEQIVPDGHGAMQIPSQARLHPVDDEDAVRRWCKLAGPDDRSQFIHPTCYRGQRLNRLKFILRSGKKDEEDAVDLVKWLERIGSADPESASEVLQLVRRIHEVLRDYTVRNQLRRARLILAEDGQLVAATDAVFSSGVVPAGKWAVHHAVFADKEARQVLEQVLSVRPLDDAQWRALLAEASTAAERTWSSKKDEAWKHVWDVLRDAPEIVSKEFVAVSDSLIRVRSLDGEWELSSQLLLPGNIAPNDPSMGTILVDQEYHADDEALLGTLGVRSEPPNRMLPWVDEAGVGYQRYRSSVRPRYSSNLSQKKPTPQWGYLDFLNGATVLAGAPLLPLTRDAARVKLSALLLERLERHKMQPIAFGHTTRPEVYESIEVPAPTCWLLANYGVVELEHHHVTIADLAAAHEMPWVQQLPGWGSVIAKMELLLSGFMAEWTAPAGDLKSLWPAALATCESPAVPHDVRRACYEAAAQQDHVPSQICVESELVPLDLCYVTSSDALASQAKRSGLPVQVLAADALETWSEHGAQNLTAVARIEHDGLAPEPLSLLDVVPQIAPGIADDSREAAWVRACQNLRMQIGEVKAPLPATYNDGSFLVDLERLADMPWQDRLTILVHEADNAGWLNGEPDHIAREIVQHNFIRRRAEVASRPSLGHRLLAAVGDIQDALLETFDDAVRRAVELKDAMDPLDVACLALAVHGPTVLAVLQEQLEKEGLQPPRRWGTQDSLDFAASLGFPPEFGGSRSARRSAELWASGPMPLGDLHDYQERLVDELGGLIAGHETEPARAVLSLPTGSGKTRVAVETALNWTLNDGRMTLWIAQTDELCEQAVQSFRQVWANRGQAWTDLRIFRLWGGNPNPVASASGVPTVVVASIQTLISRISGGLPDWVREASLVVIDEAHHAIAPSYTRLLNWLAGKQADETKTTPPPLLGLSATPFRGRGEEESRRLARRFNGRLFPSPEEQGDLYQKLQAGGILSEIAVEPLTYAQPFELTDVEKEQVAIFDEFPDTAAQRLGEDSRRNDQIVQAVRNYAVDGQVLLFANSVWHASHLAALLQLRGVPAAVVHGGTEASARQYFIKQFQNRSIRVLCNYAVLTTGFDAPRTDVIVISRPVFSPVRYMQMVGRGLRGEKNGGTVMCRVVTVLDNIVEYSDRLAYHNYFMRYFQQ